MSDFDDFVQYQGDGSESYTVGNAGGSLIYRQSPGFTMPLHGGPVSAAVPSSLLSGVGAYSFGGVAAPFAASSAVGHPFAAHSIPSSVDTATPAARQLAGVRSGNFQRVAGDGLPGPGTGTGAGRSAAAAMVLASEDKSDSRPKFTKEDFARKHRTSDALSQIDAFKVTAKKDVEHKAGQRMPTQSLPGLSDASSGAYGFGATGVQPLMYQVPALSVVAGQSAVAHDGIVQQSVHPVAMPALWTMASPLNGMGVLPMQQDHYHHQQQQQQYYTAAAPAAASDQSNLHSEHAMLPYVHYNHMAHVGHIAHGSLPGTPHAISAGDLHAASGSFSNPTSGMMPTNLTASNTGVFDAFANSSYHVNAALVSSASAAPVELASAAVAASSGLPVGVASIALGNAHLASKVQSNAVAVDNLVRVTGNVKSSSGIGAIGVESMPVSPAPLDDFDDFVSYDSPMGPVSSSRSSAANGAAASSTRSQLPQASAAFSGQPAIRHTSPADIESVVMSTVIPPVPISDVNRAGRSIPGDGGANTRDLHRPTKIKHDAPMQKVEVIFKRYVDSDPARPLPLSGDFAGPSFGKISLNKSPPAICRDQHTAFASTKDDHRSVSQASSFAADVISSAETDADFGDFQFLPADSATTAVSAKVTSAPTLAPVVGRPAGDATLHNGLQADAQLSGSASPIASSLSAAAAAAASLVSPGRSSSFEGQPVAKTLKSTSNVGSDWLTISGKTPFEATIPHQHQLHSQLQHGQPLPQQHQSSTNGSEAENLSDEFIAFQSFLPSPDQRAHVGLSDSLPTNGSQLPHHLATAHAAATETVAHPKQSSKAANWMALSDLSEFAESESTAKSTDLMGEISVFDSVLPRVAKSDTHSNDWSMPSSAAATTTVVDDPDDFADFATFQKVEVGSSLTDSTSWHASAAGPVPASSASGRPFAIAETDDGDWGSFLGPPVNVVPAVVTASASIIHAGSVPSAATGLTGYDGLFGDGLSQAHAGSQSNVMLHQVNETFTASAFDLAATLPNNMDVGSPRDNDSSSHASDGDFEAAHVRSSHVPSRSAAYSPVATAVAASAAATSVASSQGSHVGGGFFDDDNGYDGMQPPPLDDYDHENDGGIAGASVGAIVEEEEEAYDIAFGSFSSYVGSAAAKSAAVPSAQQRSTAAREQAVPSAVAVAAAVRSTKQPESDLGDPICPSQERSSDRGETEQANAGVVDEGESAAAAVTLIVGHDHVQPTVDKASGLDRIDKEIGGRFSPNHATLGDEPFVVPSTQQSAASEWAVDGEFAELSSVHKTDAAEIGGCISSSSGGGKSSYSGGNSTVATALPPGIDALSGRRVASGVSLASSAADTSGRQNDLAAYDHDDSSSESWGFAASPPPLPPADPSADDDDDWGLTTRTVRERSLSPSSSAERDSMSGWAEFRAAAPGLVDPAAAAMPLADSFFGTDDRSTHREPPALADIDGSSSDGGWDDLHSAATTVEPPAGDSRDVATFFTSPAASASVDIVGGGTIAPLTPGQSVGDRVNWSSAADNASSSTGWASEWAAAAAASHSAACSEPERLPAATGMQPPTAKLPTIEPPDFDSSDGNDEDDWEFSAARLPAGGDSVSDRKSLEAPAAAAADVRHVHAIDEAEDDEEEEWSFGQSVPTVISTSGDDDWAFQRSSIPAGIPASSAAAAAAADATQARPSTGAGTAAGSTVKELPTSIPQTAALKVLQIAFAASAAVQWASLTVAASGLPKAVGSSLKMCRLWTRLCDLDSSPTMTDMVWSSSIGCRRMLDTLPLAEVALGRQSSSAGESTPGGFVNRSEGRAGMLMPVSLAPTRSSGGIGSSGAGVRAKEASAAAEAGGGSRRGGSTASSTLEFAQPQQHQRGSDSKTSASSSDADWMFADPVPPDLSAGTASASASRVPAVAAAQFDLDFLESLSSSTSRPLAATDSGSTRQPSLPSDLDLSFFETRSSSSGRDAVSDSKAGLKHLF